MELGATTEPGLLPTEEFKRLNGAPCDFSSLKGCESPMGLNRPLFKRLSSLCLLAAYANSGGNQRSHSASPVMTFYCKNIGNTCLPVVSLFNMESQSL